MKLGDYYEGYYKGYMRYLAPGTAQGYDGNWPRYYASNAGAGSLWQVATRNSSNSGGTAGLVTESGGGHSHTITGSTASGGGGNTGSAGSGTAFDNRPAYQDVYVWERTA